MEKICGCKVVTFGSKPIGFVLETEYDEDENVIFVIKKVLRKEVEEYLEYEEEDYIKLNVDKEKISLDELVQLAKDELEKKAGKEEELKINARVVHEMSI